MSTNRAPMGRSLATAAALALVLSGGVGSAYAADETQVDAGEATNLTPADIPSQVSDQTDAGADTDSTPEPTPEQLAELEVEKARLEALEAEKARLAAAAKLEAEAAAKLADQKARNKSAVEALHLDISSAGTVKSIPGDLTVGCDAHWQFQAFLSKDLGTGNLYSLNGFIQGVGRNSGIGFFEGQHFFTGGAGKQVMAYRAPVATMHTIRDAKFTFALPTAPLGLTTDYRQDPIEYTFDSVATYMGTKDQRGQEMWAEAYTDLTADDLSGPPRAAEIDGRPYTVYTFALGDLDPAHPRTVQFKTKVTDAETSMGWYALGTLTGKFDYGTGSCAAPSAPVVNPAPAPLPAPGAPVEVAPAPVTEAPAPAPVTEAPAPAPAVEVAAPAPVVKAAPAPAPVKPAVAGGALAPASQRMVTRTFQVDRYTARTAAQARLLASLDDDGVLKYREDRGLWGASAWQFVTVRVPANATHQQVMKAINAKTGKRIGDVNTGKRIGRARVGASYTVAWELGQGATAKKAWGANNTVNQKFFARA